MELFQLECFLAAARRGNFSKAAEDVHTTQSSLSKVIARLEEDLNASLFDRKKGKITLNSNGVLFQKYVMTAMESLHEGVTLLQKNNSANDCTVLIGRTASQRWENYLDEVQTIFPNCRLEDQIYSQDVLLDAFEQGKLDLGIMESDRQFESPYIEEVVKQPFVVFFIEGHVPSHWTHFPEEQISEEIVCFSGTEDERQFLKRMFTSAGIQPKVFSDGLDSRETARLINIGAAVGIVPAELYLHRKKESPRLQLRALPISGAWHRSIYMLRKQDGMRGEQVDLVYKEIRERLQQDQRGLIDFYHAQGLDLGI